MTESDNRFGAFEGIVRTEAAFRDVMGEVFPPAAHKELSALDGICRDFIARSPFMLIASSDGAAHPDISPRGDPAGFVTVLDDHRLAIPDRPGNRRADTFKNLLKNPHLALIFLVPGMGETLRIYGEARIVRDEALRQRMAVNGRVPDFAVVLYVERAMYHCPKCVIRACLWQPEAWPEIDGVADIRLAMRTHAKLTGPQEKLDEEARQAGAMDLY